MGPARRPALVAPVRTGIGCICRDPRPRSGVSTAEPARDMGHRRPRRLHRGHADRGRHGGRHCKRFRSHLGLFGALRRGAHDRGGPEPLGERSANAVGGFDGHAVNGGAGRVQTHPDHGGNRRRRRGGWDHRGPSAHSGRCPLHHGGRAGRHPSARRGGGKRSHHRDRGPANCRRPARRPVHHC